MDRELSKKFYKQTTESWQQRWVIWHVLCGLIRINRLTYLCSDLLLSFRYYNLCLVQNGWSYHRLDRRASLESGPNQALFYHMKLVLFDFPCNLNAPIQRFILANEREIICAFRFLKLWLGSSAIVAHVIYVVETFLFGCSGFSLVRLAFERVNSQTVFLARLEVLRAPEVGFFSH